MTVKTIDRGTYFYIEMEAEDHAHLESLMFTVLKIADWHFCDWIRKKVVWHLDKSTPALPERL